ncbi:ATPase, T2SS/T4P/T4SS family [Burkholderia ambifaria]|uniref:ATPase, T2SS/T4P/T4SS family n=1 Tax=Burkholderia ambifaria TaxID=152480 RepID=UPI0015885955|nr:ATPase, T2SS/T4P/T4SS family [Burkholderia ambifaria]
MELAHDEMHDAATDWDVAQTASAHTSEAQLRSVAAQSDALARLPFSDLFLEPSGRAWFKTFSGDPVRREVTGTALAAALDLRAYVEASVEKLDFRVKYAGVPLRGALIDTAQGGLYVFRRHQEGALEFESLGYGRRLETALLSSELRSGGLVLLTGGTSSGKTVGATALLVAFMKRYGGCAYTIENPIEVDIEGEYEGEGGVTGTIYQTGVDSDEQFAAEIRRRLRGAPNAIMIGELRTAEAVAQAFLAATSGVLVIATYHTDDQLTGLQRLSSMLRDAGYDTGLFASGLAAVVHQRLKVRWEDDVLIRELEDVSPLVIKGAEDERGLRSQLHGTDFRQMISEIDRQRRVAHNLDLNLAF